MSSTVFEKSEVQGHPAVPQWMADLLNIDPMEDGAQTEIAGQKFIISGGLLRSRAMVSLAQKQTESAFAFKWEQRDTFESEANLARARHWLIERYGEIENAPWLESADRTPVLLDAGCGAGLSALELFGPVLSQIHYLGVDVSAAVDVAKRRFDEQGMPGGFMQADLSNLPIPESSLDVIFSEGVLHHTDSTEHGLKTLAKLLRPDGCMMFYVYRRKGPIREYTDDYVRERIQSMAPQQAWDAMIPLTKLGQLLGSLDIEIDIPEAIEILEIPAGKINLQRLLYWHVFKAFYDPDLNLDELNHINFDWYAPRNAHRQSPDEVRRWCAEAGLEITREVVEPAGITIVATKG